MWAPLLCILYIVIFNWIYLADVVPSFTYLGYANRGEYSHFSLVLSSLVAVGLVLRLPRSLTRPSYMIIWILFLFVYIPSSFIPFYTLSNADRYWTYLIAQAACFFILIQLTKIPIIKLPDIPLPQNPLLRNVAALLVLVTIYALLVPILGLAPRFDSILNVYEVRDEVKSDLASTGFATSYLLGWMTKVINPFLIIIGLYSKRHSLLLLGTLGQIYFFLTTGSKTTLFSIPMLLTLFYFIPKNRNRIGPALLLAPIVIIALSKTIDVLIELPISALSLFVRRVIATPGLLSGFYFDFFSENPFYFLSHSVLSGITTSPHSLSPPFVIGEEYFGNYGMSANANLFADGFANFGYPGMILTTLILGLYFVVLDSYAVRKRMVIASSLLTVYSAIALVDSALLTSLLTHGMLLSVLLIATFPSLSKSPGNTICE